MPALPGPGEVALAIFGRGHDGFQYLYNYVI